jgi:iron(III) transport system ATP-binding protein
MDTAPHTQRKVRVEIENVSLAYGTTQVLRDVSLDIKPGEFFALLGPSGSGKSTLLRMLAGFNQPQTGTIKVDGADITGIAPWRRDIGMVFQNYALWPHMTVAQNVAFGLEERKLPRADVVRRTAAALELVGLADYGARRPNQLSGGQQQRVAVARTIAIEPKVLLLDEPLSNLDAKLRVHMRVELLALQRKLGITTIFVTHDQEEALSIADRVAVLDAGVIQQVGAPTELYDRPVNRFIANFIGTINLLPGSVDAAGRFTSPQLGSHAFPVAAPGGPAELAIRPHALTVIDHHAAPAAGRAWLAGTVTEREFLGEFMRYRVDAAGAVLVADVPHFGGHGFAPGAVVRLGIDPATVTVLPLPAG